MGGLRSINQAKFLSPVRVNCRDPAVIREGQLHPSKPTNPPARSIVSSVPLPDILTEPLSIVSKIKPDGLSGVSLDELLVEVICMTLTHSPAAYSDPL
jgi:hypothetical protein